MSGQEDPTNWISSPFQQPLAAGSSSTAVTSSATALGGTSALPPSLPRASLALLYPSHPTVPRDEVHRSRFQTAFSELPPAALQRHCIWAHGDKDTAHHGPLLPLCSRGLQHLFSLEFGVKDPISVLRQDLGEALWHPATSHCNSSIRLDILNPSLGVVKPFSCFSLFFVSLCSGH